MTYIKPVAPDDKIRLRDYDPGATPGAKEAEAAQKTAALTEQLTALQAMQYAAGQHGVLVVLQGLDTAGKDGTIKHVMSGFNALACRVESFKVPTAVEAAHDFLWRAHLVTPQRGFISIFNRSYYEDVLVVRVHKLAPKEVWRRRFEHINHFESLLRDSDTIVLKFFLYISKDEQRERLLVRQEDKEKAWKLSTSDWPEHELYDSYIEAYEDVLNKCSTKGAPWYVVPANHKWYRNLAVAQAIVDAMKPYESQWRHELERRGRQNLDAISARRTATAAKSDMVHE